MPSDDSTSNCGSDGSDLGVDSADSDSWFPMLFNFLFVDFRTTKLLKLRSPYLRVPEFLFILVVFAYVVGYQLCYELKCMKSVPVINVATVEGRMPADNFWDCQYRMGDCKRRNLNLSGISYCRAKHDNSNPIKGCLRYSAEDPINDVVSERHMQPTAVVYTTERRCAVHEQCDWTADPNATSVYYVGGTEQHLIKIHNLFKTASTGGQFFPTDQLQGFILWYNETVPRRIPCRGSLCTDSNFWHRMYPKTCGSPPAADAAVTAWESVCFSDVSSDYISVDIMLKAAGISSLDEIMSFNRKWLHGNGTLRSLGVNLVLDIQFSTRAHFWSSPIGRKPRYVIVPRSRAALTGHSSGNSIRGATRASSDAQTRTHLFYRGISLTLLSTGHHIEFDATETVFAIGASVALFKASQLFVNHIIRFMYLRYGSTQGISQLLTRYRTEVHSMKDRQPRVAHLGGDSYRKSSPIIDDKAV